MWDNNNEGWKDAEVLGPIMTEADAVKFRTQGTRILWQTNEMQWPIEGLVLEVSPNRKFVMLQVTGMFGGQRRWFAVSTVHVCSVLPMIQTPTTKRTYAKRPAQAHECTCGHPECPICGD